MSNVARISQHALHQGGVCSWGGYLPLVCGGCLLLGGVCHGGCLLLGMYLPLVRGVPASGPKGVPASGLGVWGYLPREGVGAPALGYLPGGCTCPGGVPAQGVPVWVLYLPRGHLPGGCLPGGVSAWRVSAWGVSAQGGVCHVTYPIVNLMLPVCCLHTN